MSKTTSIPCSQPDCRAPAAYKIAARWSDGHLAELKTYGFACSEHLGDSLSRFRAAPVELHLRRRANRSKNWRSIATSPANATVSCNDCGGWKRITGREAVHEPPGRPGRNRRLAAMTANRSRELRRASVTNGATGAAIARRTAPGFPSIAD